MSEPKNQDKSGKPISRSKEKRAKNAPFPSSVMVDSSLGGKGNPGWLHTPPVAVSPEDAKRLIEARTLKGPRNYKPVTRTHSIAAESSNTVQSPASIVELARALKNDADLIFYHVYNNIEFHPTWGVQKGSLGCLIDGIGNSFDQCALLVDLLREAGYTANFVSGVLRLEEEDVAGWLGTDPSNLYFSSYVLSQGGIPNEVVYVGGPTFNYVIDVSHIWVEVTIGGTDYVFDPAFKSYSTVAGINLGTALDYSQSELLDGADDGATIDMDGNYIEDVNAANIKAQLATYAGNLIDWIKTNNPDATMDEIVGGRTINQIFTPVRVTTHPKLKPATTPDVWSSISNSYRVTVRLEYAPYWSGSIDETFYSDELYGKRLTLFFNGSLEAELRLDGTLIATSSAQSAGTTSPMRITVDHPYGVNWFDQTFYQNVYAPHATLGQTYYLIGNAFGPTKKGMVDFHQHQLALAELAGGGDLSDSVLGERLSILWHTYTAEHFRIGDILGRMTECIGLAHHMIGMCAHSTYPDDGFGFFDVQGVRIAGQSLDNTTTDSAKYMTALGMHGYTLEQLVPQQVLGQTDGAAATKLLEVANADGVRIYKATGANWSSDVSPNLTGYNLANPSDLYTYYLQYGWVGVIPEEADQVIGPLTTEGWSVLNPSGGGFGILQASYGGICPWGWRTRKPPKEREKKHDDPVGLRTGDFYYWQTDLTVGSQNFPYQLSFETRYRSNQRYHSGPLGLGWNHNWQISATKDSNGFKGLGIDSPIDAAASITEFYACLDLLTDTDFPILNLMTAILGNAWWCEQLTGNVVIVESADDTFVFTKLPDGSYNAPHRDRSTLVQNMDGTYSLTSPQQVEQNFDEDGNLETWVFPDGVTITLTYSSGKLQTVSNGMGRTLYFDYVGDKLLSVSDDAERTAEYTIDVDDQLTAITDVLEEDTTFEYDELGRMIKYFLPEHPSDPMVTNTYDTLDRIESQLDMNLKEQSFFLAGWRSETVNAVEDSVVSYFDNRGNLIKQIDELGCVTTLSYDGRDRVMEMVMPEGNSIGTTYDDNNNVLTITQVAKPGSALDDIVETRTYDSTFNKVDSIEDGRGNTTTFSYDPVTGSLLTIEKPEIESEVPTITFTYTVRGQVETREDETGIVTKYEYSSTDETLETVTVDFGMGRLNLATNLTYFEWGDVETVTDARSNTTTYTFNDKRQLTQIESPSPFNFLTKFTYDKNGNRTKVERQTDDVGHPWQTFEAGYNLANQIESLKDPLGNETVREYNDLRQLWKVTDPEERTTTYTYDARGMLETITDPDSVVIETRTYTDNGKLASQEDARNNVTSMTYDGFDRLDTTTYADETFEQNVEYDKNGNVLSKLTRNGDTIAFTFDVLNRMETKSPDGMPTVTFTYDLAGRLKKASTPVVAGNPGSGDWEFEFDTAGRLVLEISPDAKEVAYDPDENGNITKITYPDSYYVERFYDEMNRLTDIKLNGDTDPAAHFTYDSLSRRQSIEYDNTTEITYDYEWNDDMSSIEHLFDGSSVEFTHGFNDAHQVESQTVSDAQHMWHPSTTGTTTYTTANEVNQYPAVGGKDFTYNRNGCLTSDGDMLFNYDTENHLTTAIRCDGMSTYLYDPMHRQIQKKVGCSSKTRFVYSGWQRLADYDEEDTLQNRYVYGTKLDEPLIQVSGTGDLSYFHHDRLGSIIAITDDTGAVLNRYAYSPWGECDDMSGTTFGFTGQRYDAESGLFYFKQRHYSSITGRFLQQDPLLYSGNGLNLYMYVENDPLNMVDELGLAGTLTINTITTGDVGWGTHSWIGYQRDGEVLHTYGTYSEGAALTRGYHQGIVPETDKTRTPNRKRQVHLSDADEVVLKYLLLEIGKRGTDAWKKTNPCSGFASEVWERMTHEKLDKRQIILGIPVITPKSLGDAIFEANGNRDEGTLYLNKQFSPADFVVGESD